MNKSIKEVRLKAGLTQKQVQDLLGIPIRTLQNWEAGVNKCPDYVERLIIEKLEKLLQEGGTNEEKEK